MSSEHKKPLYAFVVIAVACAAFMGYTLRAHAVGELLRGDRSPQVVAAMLIPLGGDMIGARLTRTEAPKEDDSPAADTAEQKSGHPGRILAQPRIKTHTRTPAEVRSVVPDLRKAMKKLRSHGFRDHLTPSAHGPRGRHHTERAEQGPARTHHRKSDHGRLDRGMTQRGRLHKRQQTRRPAPHHGGHHGPGRR